MSILDRVIQTDLAESGGRLHSHFTRGVSLPLETEIDNLVYDDSGSSVGKLLEIYLRAVATIEAGMEIGERCDPDRPELSFARELLSHPDIQSYCSFNRLALPMRFLSRLRPRARSSGALRTGSSQRSRPRRRFALASDGAVKDHVSTIDYLKPKQRVVNAFHDAASLALDSLNHNLFLEVIRRHSGTFSEMIDTIKDPHKLAEALQSAALLEAGELGLNPTMFEGSPSNPQWNIDATARLLLALSRLQLVFAELDAALSTIEQESSNFLAVYQLITAHFLPDYSNLGRAIDRVTDAVGKSLAELFELRTDKQTGATSGQFSTITLPISVSLVDEDYSQAVPISALRSVSRAPLPPYGHEAFKAEGQYLIAQLSRHRDTCSHLLLRLSANERRAWAHVDSGDDNFQNHLKSRLAVL